MSRPIQLVTLGSATETLDSSFKFPSLTNGKVFSNGTSTSSSKSKLSSLGVPNNTRSPRPILPPPPQRALHQADQSNGSDYDYGDRKIPIATYPPPFSPSTAGGSTGQLPQSPSAAHNRHLSLDSVAVTALVADQGSIGELLHDVVQQRAKIVDKRVSIKQQQMDLELQLPLHRGAYAEMMQTLRSVVPEVIQSNLPARTKKLLDEVWFNFDNFSKTLERWQERLNREQNDLWRWESRLVAKEEELYKKLSSIAPVSAVTHVDIYSDTFIPPTVLMHSSRCSSSSSDIAPEESDYYRAIGKINLLRDEIFNFESQFRMDKHQRDEQGLDPEVSEQQFFIDYFREREAIVKKYVEAKTAMESLAQRCLERGLNIERPNLPPFLDQMFNNDPDIFLDPEHKHRKAARSSDARVIRWIRHVLRASLPEAVNLIDTPEVRFAPEGVSTFSHFHHLRPPTESEVPDSHALLAHSSRHPKSFQAELGQNRRRSSAPDLRHTGARTIIGNPDAPAPEFCKTCLEEGRPQSVSRCDGFANNLMDQSASGIDTT